VKRRRIAASISCGVSFLLLTCGDAPAPPPSPSDTNIVIGIPEARTDLENGLDQFLRLLTFESLTNNGADGRPIPRLAERWEWENDNTRLRLFLRPNVFLHDGRSFKGDTAVAVVRSAIQLTAIGYVIKLIFDQDSIWLVFALLTVMVLFGAITARARAKKVPGAFGPLLIALALAGATTLGLVVALGVFDPKPRFLVPVGGMVIGNAMTASAVALNRLGDEMHDSRARIEATRPSLPSTFGSVVPFLSPLSSSNGCSVNMMPSCS